MRLIRKKNRTEKRGRTLQSRSRLPQTEMRGKPCATVKSRILADNGATILVLFVSTKFLQS